MTPKRRALEEQGPSTRRAGTCEEDSARRELHLVVGYVLQMDLHTALRHAVSRNGEYAERLSSNQISVNFVGSIEINDEGVRRRRIGPVLIAPELATPFVRAVLSGDERKAADEFQHAFAESYGVGYVTISDVSQLEIGEASS